MKLHVKTENKKKEHWLRLRVSLHLPTLSPIGWSHIGQLMSGLFKPDLSLNTCTEKKTLWASEHTFIEDPVEEGAAVIQRAFRPPTQRVFRDEANPLAFPDEYLWERYQLNIPSVVYRCTLQGPRLSETTQAKPWPQFSLSVLHGGSLPVGHYSSVGDAWRYTSPWNYSSTSLPLFLAQRSRRHYM